VAAWRLRASPIPTVQRWLICLIAEKRSWTARSLLLSHLPTGAPDGALFRARTCVRRTRWLPMVGAAPDAPPAAYWRVASAGSKGFRRGGLKNVGTTLVIALPTQPEGRPQGSPLRTFSPFRIDEATHRPEESEAKAVGAIFPWSSQPYFFQEDKISKSLILLARSERFELPTLRFEV
jgi:hypothetical protein